MKNLKMKVKLMISFVMVAVLTLAVGAMGVWEVKTLSQNESVIYTYGLGTNGVTSLQANIQGQRAAYRGASMLYLGEADFSEDLARLETLDAEFKADMAWLLNGVDDEGMRSMLSQANSKYEKDYAPLRDQLVSALRAGNEQLAQDTLNRILEPIGEIEAQLNKVTEEAMSIMAATQARDLAAANRGAVVILIICAIAIALAIFFAFYISHIIAAPLERMAREVMRLTTGDFNVNPDIDQKDEIGVVDHALWKIVSTMMEQQQGIIRMAEGDYTVSFPIRSAEDTMNKALNTLVDNFNAIMEEIRDSATQVSGGSSQIAHAAQTLAAGSSEQATTIEELSATLTNIQGMAETNSSTASATLADFQDAARLTEKCNIAMEQMLQAMEQINEKSDKISHVIKAIDDIAFQTNILALNAAVEAARAGQHGKGFAVVAEEVRNLASKSAEAAKETAKLIQESIGSVSEGNAIVDRVGTSIRAVGDIAGRNQHSLEGIDQASRSQKDSINEVAGGIKQLSSVVQANADSAEATAASSEEMTAQAASLEGIFHRFTLRKSVKTQPIAAQPIASQAIKAQPIAASIPPPAAALNTAPILPPQERSVEPSEDEFFLPENY